MEEAKTIVTGEWGRYFVCETCGASDTFKVWETECKTSVICSECNISRDVVDIIERKRPLARLQSIRKQSD